MSDSPCVQSLKLKVRSNIDSELRTSCFIRGDETLNSIAELHFHDPDIAWLLADLNHGRVREHKLDGRRIIRVKERQEILLPNWRDIVRFYQYRANGDRAKNLITIIEKSRVDMHRVNVGLARIILNTAVVT